MLTMPRIPSDSFLPTGGMHFGSNSDERPLPPGFSATTSAAHMNGRSPSAITPLSLPNAIDQLSYLGGLASLPPSNQRHLLPPRSHSDPQDQRTTKPQTPSGIVSPSVLALCDPTHSDAPDRTSIPALAQQLKRVVLQNRRLLENWEAERTHLEANRARAEEVYKEEREIMDEERIIWAGEKARLETEVLEWKKRAEIAESEREIARKEADALRKQCDTYRTLAGNPLVGRATGSSGGTPPASGSGSSGSPGGRATSVQFQHVASSTSPPTSHPFSGLGTTMPESRPFEPLDPRMQSGSSALATPTTEKGPAAPSANISDLMPGLEGIRVKRTAFEKSTFTDEKTSSPSTPQDSSPDSRPRSNPAQITKQALEAPERSRLTMHAGHTPNHSISLSRLQTVQSTLAANTANSSGAATPTQELVEPDLDLAGLDIPMPVAAPLPEEACDDEEPLGLMNPSEGDRPLEGPLQLRNRPASDEPFLRRLSDKLEDSIRSNDTTPTVLRDADTVSPPPASPPQQVPEAEADTSGGGVADQAGPAGVGDKDDEDIPLKIKSTSNFGLPLGEAKN